MKAWRKYNMGLAAQKEKLEQQIEECKHYLDLYIDEGKNVAVKFRLKVLQKRLQGLSRITKSQRKTVTAPEMAQPSGLLYVLFKQAGLPVPDSIDSLLHSSGIGSKELSNPA